VPIEALDLALANWAAPQRASAGFPDWDAEQGFGGEAAAALGV